MAAAAAAVVAAPVMGPAMMGAVMSALMSALMSAGMAVRAWAGLVRLCGRWRKKQCCDDDERSGKLHGA